MATVITNLLSAIPFFGQDLVESNYNFATEILTTYGNTTVKNSILTVLPTVGTISSHALKMGRQLRLDKKKYLSIPYQFISFLVGLIDGDGYILIAKTSKGFITIKLVIDLNLKDLSTLEYIHSVLKLGKITIYRDHLNPNCKLIINKTDLQEVLFPLLKHHNIFFLIKTRKEQFDLAMHIFENNLKSYYDIPNVNNISSSFKLLNTSSDYLKLEFYRNWLVGFTIAEGSFLIKINKDACFQLKQVDHSQLFESLKILFNTNCNLYFEKDKFVQFSVSSQSDLQKVIDFFSFSGLHPLIGLKNIQYFNWLNNLKKTFRYKNLNFPK